jgi:hypothetical protein
VRVHADTKAANSARVVNGLAYTIGPHIVFGRGQYSPLTSAGTRLLAHELTHVLQQQAAGSASPFATNISHVGEPAETEANDAANSVHVEPSTPAIGTLSVGKLQRQDDGSNNTAPTPLFDAPVTPAPAPPISPPTPLPPKFQPQAWLCGRPLRYPGLSLGFGHAFVAAPPDNYAIIAPLCTPTDGGSDNFFTGTAARKWDNSPDPCDDQPECVVCQPKVGVKDVKQCLRDTYNAYNIPTMHAATGPNSNTLAGTMGRACCDGVTNATPFYSTLIYPGWGDAPAPSRPAKCPSGPPQCT